MPNFSSKEEAIEFYRQEEPSLHGMPDYLIGCLIDFSKKYDNYDEYLVVENKVQNNKTLTKKEQKKYGHLKFDKVHVTHPKNAVINDHITTHKAGEFEDIGTKEGFEKVNKYGLTYSEKQEPNKTVKFQFKDKKTGDFVMAERSIEDINQNPESVHDPSAWDIKHTIVNKKLEE